MDDGYALKGLHKVKRKLSDGSVRTHYYAWRGGPAMIDEAGNAPAHGSVEFLTLFRALTAPAERVPMFADIIDAYEASRDFLDKAPKTRKDYQRYLDMIRAKWGTLPLIAFTSPKIRGGFKAWRDSMAAKRRTADYAWTMLARLCSFGVDRGELTVNPCLRGGRLYTADRNEQIWTESHLLQLFAAASPEIVAVVTYALWTGQRQADCITAKWSDLQVGKIRVKQAKGGRRVMIPIGRPLADLIEGLPRRGETILVNSRGQAWTSDGFRASFGTAMSRAGITDDLHFHDLRGTAVTRMALAGCTVPQIAAVTGHAPKRVDDILAAHYLGGRAELAEQAIQHLEARHG